ncbi:hypothetical protein [Sphingomonas sp. SRS2]|uniref:hypothetical protein n=1 Tax=Sphingomonas sp. SRS2 TaxID=133190 RepID=UPI0006184B3B|nr:hypothetical protein [Sphingomonas sp. SRS2]KKC24791.1 hypothetical protein WP12_17525 [Sphingomonas sp. SRS2]
MDLDSDYYLTRAEAELVLAQRASHPAAVRAHYYLAGHYLDKAYSRGIEKAPSPLQKAMGMSLSMDVA